MNLYHRHNFKWNVNEVLSLQREYELLEMTIQDIAFKHERSIDAILYKLQKEGFIECWVDARGYQEYSKNLDYLIQSYESGINAYDYGEDIYDTEDEDDQADEDYEDDENSNNISTLSQRIWGLESAVTDIKSIIGTLLSRIRKSTVSEEL